jgi:hypothetical protein
VTDRRLPCVSEPTITQHTEQYLEGPCIFDMRTMKRGIEVPWFQIPRLGIYWQTVRSGNEYLEELTKISGYGASTQDDTMLRRED